MNIIERKNLGNQLLYLIFIDIRSTFDQIERGKCGDAYSDSI